MSEIYFKFDASEFGAEMVEALKNGTYTFPYAEIAWNHSPLQESSLLLAQSHAYKMILAHAWIEQSIKEENRKVSAQLIQAMNRPFVTRKVKPPCRKLNRNR